MEFERRRRLRRRLSLFGLTHKGRRLNVFLGLSLNDKTNTLIAMLLDKTASVR